MSKLTTLRCPSCGAPMQYNTPRCAYCGSLIVVSEPTEVALPAVAQAQQLAAQMQERLTRNPYDGDAYYQLGLATMTLGLYEQAENAFDQAQRHLPGSPLAHFFKGLAMLLRGESEILSLSAFRLRSIQREFDTALELNPGLTTAAAYRQVVRGLVLRSEEDYAGAIRELAAAAKQLPDLALIYKVLAGCYFQTDDLPAALRSGERALALRPRDEDTAFLLGVAHLRLGQYAEMERYARRVAQLRGDETRWQRVVREFLGDFE